MNRAHRLLLGLLLTAALAGCGGGGGGGGGGNNGGGGGGGGAVTGISITPSTLSFTANQDDPDPPPAQTITITALGSGTTYIRGENGTLTGLSCSGSSCTYSVRPANPPYSYLSPGTTTNGLTFIGCADQACATGAVPNGRQTVTYTYTITPGLDVSPSPALTVNGVEGVPTPPQTLTLTHPSGIVQPWQATFTPTGAGPAFVTLNPASTSAPASSPSTLQAQFSTLSAGTYTGTIEVQPATSPRRVKRDVTYVVQSALSTTSTLSFVIDASTQAAGLQQTLTLAAAPGVAGSLGWIASVDSPWLQLLPTSGDTGSNNQIVVSLPPAQLERLPKGVYTTDITLVPSGASAFSTLKVHVSLDMRLPHTEFVMPRVVAEGSTGEAFIRGSGFSALSGTVKFGNTNATTATRDSDTAMRATHSALTPPGTYKVDLGIQPNALGLNRERAQLTVANTSAIAASAFAPADLASTGTKYALVFDDARLALYIANVQTASPSSSSGIGRLVWNGAGWSADGLPVPLLRDIALSPGGDELLALTSGTITRIDPVAWSVAGTVSLPTDPITPPPPGRSFGIGNDGRLLISQSDVGTSTNIVYYDPASGSFTNEFLCCITGNIRASGDGSVVYLLGQTSTRRYDVKTRTYTDNSASGGATGKALSVSRTGARFIVDGTHVYNGDFTSRGTLSVVSGETVTAGAITADGARAYAYSDAGKLYGFDLESFMNPGVFAPISGTPITLSDPVGASAVMTTSVDGRLVFIAGDDRVIIQPAPP